jgi:uncharacterized protein (DUF1501 family)
LAPAAFAASLGADGMRKVILVTISEFGRRAGQNGSGGLDVRLEAYGSDRQNVRAR